MGDSRLFIGRVGATSIDLDGTLSFEAALAFVDLLG